MVATTHDTVAALEARVADLEKDVASLRRQVPEDRTTILVFSGDLDKTVASFIIATGAAALGHEVTMFFTFWGLSILKRRKRLAGKSIAEALLELLTPGGTRDLQPSKLAFMGAGAVLLRRMMHDKGVASLEDLVGLARDSGVKLLACEMSMEVMGIRKEDLFDGLEVGGVAAFLGDATRSRLTLAF